MRSHPSSRHVNPNLQQVYSKLQMEENEREPDPTAIRLRS